MLLHEGHLSLVRAAKAECDITVVWIYVNPSQFGPHEDLATYPRSLAADLEKLAACGTDFVLAPDDAEVYPPGHATRVDVGSVAEPLEGRFRPGHFRGVATVVLKMFNMTQPDAGLLRPEGLPAGGRHPPHGGRFERAGGDTRLPDRARGRRPGDESPRMSS